MTTRRSIKEPIPQIFGAAELLSLFADAHLAGDTKEADRLLREANCRDVWNWTNPHWDKVHLNPRYKHHLAGDTMKFDEHQLDPLRYPTDGQWRSLIQRDGYHCRYCGIPVVDDAVRKWVALRAKSGPAKGRRPFEAAVTWDSHRNDLQHAAFQCMWIQPEHIVPHSHGGRTDLSNVVVSCALCNFGKWDWTLRQLEICDPRDFPPLSPEERRPVGWDGLSRLMTARGLTYHHLYSAETV